MTFKISTLIVIMGTSLLFSQSNVDIIPTAKVKVSITTDKRRYKVGEPIQITVTLRNEGHEPVWISKPMGLGRYTGCFFVNVIGPDGKLLPNTSPIFGGAAAQEGADVFQNFLSQRIAFQPGHFWGFSGNIENTGVAPSRRGRYKLEAEYVDEPISDLSDAASRKLHEEVRFPILDKPIAAQPIFITIE